VLSVGSHGVDQLIVQRYLSARNLRDAQRALLWSGPIVGLQFAFFLLLGLGLSYFYALHPPDQPFADSDHVFADYVISRLPAGLVGVVLGAVFAAAMSTLSSSLNASAAALVNDFVLPATGRKPGDPFTLRAARWATLLFAALQVGVGISGLGGGAVVGSVLAIASITTGVILGLFLLALPRRPDPRASLIGLVVGLATVVIVVFLLPRWQIDIGWPWRGVLSGSATFLAGALARRLSAL